MNITKAQAAALGRRAQQPVKEPGDLIAIFVEGKLVNPTNDHTSWGWQKRSRLAKEWRQRVAQALLERLDVRDTDNTWNMFMPAPIPKHVTFLASTHNAMDGDGLQAALKPVRDALVECGVVSGDADRDGHTFTYAQQIDRKRRGVEIRVRLRGDRP